MNIFSTNFIWSWFFAKLIWKRGIYRAIYFSLILLLREKINSYALQNSDSSVLKIQSLVLMLEIFSVLLLSFKTWWHWLTSIWSWTPRPPASFRLLCKLQIKLKRSDQEGKHTSSHVRPCGAQPRGACVWGRAVQPTPPPHWSQLLPTTSPSWALRGGWRRPKPKWSY